MKTQWFASYLSHRQTFFFVCIFLIIMEADSNWVPGSPRSIIFENPNVASYLTELIPDEYEFKEGGRGFIFAFVDGCEHNSTDIEQFSLTMSMLGHTLPEENIFHVDTKENVLKTIEESKLRKIVRCFLIEWLKLDSRPEQFIFPFYIV